MMTQFQNTHGFLSTRKRMRDLWVGVGNLGNLGVGKSLVLRQESYLNSYFSQLKAIYIKRLIVAHGKFLGKLDKDKNSHLMWFMLHRASIGLQKWN